MAESNKHTIYIDVDDEITAIIDKVKSAPGKIVALVLPKRATVLQSIINMKLLKKAAGEAKKNLVLITSEVGLMPLAGAVGVHVAKSLQSKPEIPLSPNSGDDADPEISEAMDEDEPKLDKSKAVGAFAAATPKPKVVDDDDTETIALDDLPAEDDGNAGSTDVPSKKQKKGKKGLKIPNFDRFRLSFFLIILAVIVLIGSWIAASIILPKASITIKTDTTTITSSISFEANTATTDLSVDKLQVPAVQKESKKTATEKATATGQKDNGTKATGSITTYNCTDNDVDVPSGTSFSTGSLTYASDTTVTVPHSNASFGGVCLKNHSAVIPVTAANGGTSYNLEAGHTFTSNFASTLTGTGSAMTGGTTNIITVVSQADIDNAVAKIKGTQDSAAKTDLAAQLKADGLTGLQDTLITSDPAVTATPAVGQPATGDVTVTAITTYDILGVKADYLSQLIKKDVSGKIDSSKQSVLDDGLGAATITVATRKSPTDVQMSLQALVVAGPQLNPAAIKEAIKGKKKGDAENIISATKGVTDVTIKYSPFWVYATPKSTKKITITIDKPTVKPAKGSQTPDVSIP